MTSYKDNKSLVVAETNNAIEKLTEEFAISPTYACIQMGSYCYAQIASIYLAKGNKVPKELTKFLDVTYPKILAEMDELIKEQTLMLNVSGSA